MLELEFARHPGRISALGSAASPTIYGELLNVESYSSEQVPVSSAARPKREFQTSAILFIRASLRPRKCFYIGAMISLEGDRTRALQRVRTCASGFLLPIVHNQPVTRLSCIHRARDKICEIQSRAISSSTREGKRFASFDWPIRTNRNSPLAPGEVRPKA